MAWLNEEQGTDYRATSPLKHDDHHPLCIMCHVSHVTCHMSCVMCHMSHVTCHMPHVACKQINKIVIKRWSELLEGLLSTGPNPSSFHKEIIFTKSLSTQKKTHFHPK